MIRVSGQEVFLAFPGCRQGGILVEKNEILMIYGKNYKEAA